MIALNHDWSGLTFITIKGTPGYSGNRPVRNNFYSVMYDSNMSPNKSYFICLPLISRSWDIYSRSNKPINSAHRDFTRNTFNVFYLELVTAAKINSAVASFRKFKFHTQFKIIELFLGYHVAANALVYKYTVYHSELVVVGNNPAGKIIIK